MLSDEDGLTRIFALPREKCKKCVNFYCVQVLEPHTLTCEHDTNMKRLPCEF